MPRVATWRRQLRRPAVLIVASVALLGAGGGAQAGGLFDFFNALGGGEPQQSQPLPQPDYASPERPLTVRPHQQRRHRMQVGHSGGGSGGRYNVADIRGVTMYTDKTLSRGDAVMTPTGIKVFNGSSSWPYTDDDFVALSSSAKMPKVIRTELTAMDNASRPALLPH